ncbi:rRNA processing/ribosome biogenesis-domain-containing protein [Podospora appendiculata]|uniref:Pre-rRNA-processing protein RIX1 n=1 Tax=Podospora appendiculata TaxID=314037 RepID=A0AAE0XGE0_9PEZI|nr:rRNA processing/ribosome biogenesis-domain-containing protein [Podospora appendiculata]
MSAPPELRVLCRRLASTPVDDLPRLCSVLVDHVLRCGAPLSSAAEAKGKDKLSETPVLVHRLKTHINTLLTGKNPSGRFAAISLIKAVIDVGGWECLRASAPWIRGLISVLQKPDPFASKELAIVTLTRIYSLLQGYQTLIREMATPTLPDYVKACLQLIKAPASGKPLKTPVSLIDTVICSLAKIVSLYPTTMRPFAAEIRSVLKAYVAPTSADSAIVPQSLRECSRRLHILLHYTAPKNGSGTDWARSVGGSITHCHATADQVFRAVVESWQSTTGHRAQTVRLEADPAGGGDAADEFPPWTGLEAGADRLVGLLELLSEYLKAPTKTAVAIPVGELLDLTSRITLVTLPTSGSDSVELNAAIGRDEKAELWSVLPEIHTAALRLHTSIIRRLQNNALPLSTDLLDQMVRVFNSSRHIPSVRETTYILANEILLLSGPTLLKLTVNSLASVIQSCCQDILRAAGHADDNNPSAAAAANGTSIKQKTTPVNGNADAFLTAPGASAASTSVRASHKAAADALLPLFLSHLPQRHLSPDARGLVDRTAILSNNKTAMLASCLYPYRDSRGRFYPSILPFLVRQFPHDQGVEVLRTNLRAAQQGHHTQAWDPREGLDELLQEHVAEDMEADEQATTAMDTAEDGGDHDLAEAKPSGWLMQTVKDAVGSASTGIANQFFAGEATAAEAEPPAEETSLTPLKRKGELIEAANAKRRADKKAREIPIMSKAPEPAAPVEADEGESDSESDAGSIQIDMTLDDEEEEEEDDEDDE